MLLNYVEYNLEYKKMKQMLNKLQQNYLKFISQMSKKNINTKKSIFDLDKTRSESILNRIILIIIIIIIIICIIYFLFCNTISYYDWYPGKRLID